MTLTLEKMDELERLANAAAEVLCCRVGEVRDYVLYESVLRDLVRELDTATVRELVRAARERDAQAAKLAKAQELRDAIEAFMRSPQKKDDKARAWEFGNCIAYIKNGLDAIGDEA